MKNNIEKSMSVKKELDKKFSGKKISAEKSAAGENVKDNKISREVKKEKSKTGVTATESGVTDLLSLYLGEKVAVSATAEPVQGNKKKTGSSASKAAAGSAGKNSKKIAGSANAETGDGELSELVVYAAERTIIKAGFDSVNASLNNPNAADGEYLGNLRKIINRQSVSKKYGLTEIKKVWCDLTAGKVLIPVDLGANTIVLPADSLENIEGKVVYEYEKIEEVDIVYYSKKLESVETGETSILYLPDLTVFHGDTVRCVRNRRTGIAYYVSTVDRHNLILGRWRKTKDRAVLNPEDPRFGQLRFAFRKLSDVDGIGMGSIVICRIVKRHPSGDYIVEVEHDLKDGARLDSRIQIALVNNGIPHEWNEAVRKQADNIPDEVQEKDKDAKKRVDLRSLPLVTIDGADARDFDDAVYCRKEGTGFRLFVAIADVSFYVRNGSPLDNEAKHRGTSIYFPNYVVPMLPEKLSNGLCSLNPHVDRLCMVCEMEVRKGGSIGEYRFYPAVMNSHARLTYSEVAAVLAGEDVTDPEIVPLKDDLLNLYALYKELKLDRVNRGGIEFEGSEVRFVFDENQQITDILPVVRNDAHMLIEECMIAANVCAADFVEKNKGFTLFRVHPKPAALKVTAFRNFITPYGLSLDGGDVPESSDYAAFAKKIENNPYKDILQVMMLRSLSLATYTPENEGHFGLALDHYAHFTSPIRRYPDLQLHREIKYLLGKTGVYSSSLVTSIGAKKYELPELTTLSDSCNTTERRADKVSGEVELSLKAKFIEKFIGRNLPGTVVNVTPFGLFVKINRFNIDGMIHVSQISANNYMTFDETKMRLVGEKSGFSVGLGDVITVVITDVNIDDGKITMIPAAGTFGKNRTSINEEAKKTVNEYTGSDVVDNESVNMAVRKSMAIWNNIDGLDDDLMDSVVSVSRVKSAPHAKISGKHKAKSGTEKKSGSGKSGKKPVKKAAKKSAGKASEKQAG
jgi:ribonuclease R